MTEPQVWAVIAVLASMAVGMITIVSTLFLRVVRAEIGGVRAEIGGLRLEMNARFEVVDQQISGVRAEMNARFESVDTKLRHLDRDVEALAGRAFGAGDR